MPKHTIMTLAFKLNALKLGEFTLKSGRSSPYFFDVSALLQNSEAWWTLAQTLAKTVHTHNKHIDCLFGPAYKGIPLATATACAWQQAGYAPLQVACNRKEIKSHGDSGQFMGLAPQGHTVILDDVITAGTAIHHAHQLITAAGATLKSICTVFDRQERYSSDIKQSTRAHLQHTLNCPVISLLTLDDLIEYTQTHSHLKRYTPALEAHRIQWGSPSNQT